jgi:hypothetical protein
MSQIYLTTVPEAYSFYKKYGFVNTSKYSNCNDGCIMRKYLNTSGGRKTRKRKTKTKTRKTRKRKPAHRKR